MATVEFTGTVFIHFMCISVVEKTGKNAPLQDMEKIKPLMQMVFHCIEKMKRLKLSKEV
jgi:hypothetical protein